MSTCFGIVISIYCDDHPQPHFHAAYEGEEVQVRIADLSVMAGRLSPRAMGLVVEWAAEHRRELTEDWGLAERHLPLNRIAGCASMLAEMLRISSAQALDDCRVRLTLTDGQTVERDLRALLWGPVFQPLRDDYERFRQVGVEAGTLVWPGDLDFDPDTLIWGGAPPTAPASKPPKFLRLESRRPPAEA